MSTTLGDLAVLIGAEVNEAGFSRAVSAIGGIETAAVSAAAGASAAIGQISAEAEKSAQRITDAAGRIRDGYGRFVPAATLAAEAAQNVGGSLGNLSDVAGRASASINGTLISSFASFDKAIKPLNEGIGRLGEGLKSVGGGLTTYVTLPLAGVATGAVLAAAKVDSLTRGLQAVTQQQLGEQGVIGLAGIAQAATDTQKRLVELREVAKLPGLGFTEAIQGDIRLRAVGLSADLSKKALLAFGNAIATTGGGKAELDRVTVQLGQLSAKGRVLAQDLRPIIEAAPAVATALRKLYNTVDSETISKSLQAQGKSSTDFINILTDELAKLPKVTGGLAIAGENISDSLTLAGSKIGLTAEKLFDLSGVANRAGEFIENLADKFAALDPGTQKLIFGLAAGAAAIGPLLLGFGAIVAAIPPVLAGLEVLGIASAASLGPIGIAAAAVAVSAGFIIQNWEPLSDFFTSGAGGIALTQLKNDLSDIATRAKDAATALPSLLRGDFSGALDRAKSAAAGLVDVFTTGLGGVATASFVTTIESLRKTEEGLRGAADGGGVFGTSLLQASGILTGFNVQLQGFAGGLPNYGKSIEQLGGILDKLKAKLKEVKEQRDKETTEKAIFADDITIKALEKEIARLEGTDKAGKKATDAITKLRQELARLTALDNLLGDAPSQLQVLERRSDALEKGLKTLVDAGVSTGSKAFQGFAADLVKTSQAADKLRGAALGIDLKPVNAKSLIPQTIGDTLPQDVARLLGDYAKKPVELPLKILVKVDEIGFTTSPEKALNQVLVNFGQQLKEVNATADAFGGSIGAAFNGFDAAAAKTNAARAAIQDLISKGFSPADPIVKSFVENLRNYSIESANTTILTQGLTNGLSGLGVAIGESLAGGGDILEATGKALLKSLADIGAKYGSFLIALGIGDIASGFGVAKGAAEIAAGIGLIAASSALGGFAGGGATGSTGSSLASQPKTSYSGSTASSSQASIPKEITLRLRGQDAVAVLRLGGYRNERTN